LKVTTEREENCIVNLTISVEEERADELLRRAARALSRDYRMPGFRPGKAPYNVVVRRLGIDAVHSQVLDQFGDQIFQEGLEQSKLEPVDQASLEDVTWDPFTLHLKVPVGPEVGLGTYREIRIPWEEPRVTDQALDEALLRLQKEQTEWRPDNRPAEAGDRVVLDITARVEDEVVLENTGREMILDVDSPFPVPGFAQAVVGMTPGETRQFDLDYPEDHYNADIAGKTAHFEVRLGEIRVEILPLLDDEFAMSVGDYDSLEDLKTQLRQSLQEEAEKKAEDEYEEQLWGQLLETATVEYPQVFLDHEVDAVQQQLEQQLQRQSLDLETYFRLTNTSEEAWKEQIRPQAEERLKRRLILSQVIKEQDIRVESEEIEAEVERVVEPMGEQADEMREMLRSPAGRMTVAENLLSRKAVELLEQIARGQLPEQETEAPPAEGEVAETAESPAQPAAEPAEASAQPAEEQEAPAQAEVDTQDVAPTEEPETEGAPDEQESAAPAEASVVDSISE
jgi:trigger factor